MNFEFTDEQKMVRSSVQDFVEEFESMNMRPYIENQEFPQEYWEELAANGFVGTMIPEEYGGAGMGMLEMSIILEELSKGGSPGGIMLVLTAIFGGVGITNHGTEKQKEKYLPAITEGDIQFCMGLTEANAGVNSLQIETFAEEVEEGVFEVDGQKMFISGVDHADAMLLITRTKPFDGDAPTDGITLFIVPEPADQDAITLNKVEVGVPWYEAQYEVNIDGLRLTEDQILGGPENKDVALYNLWDTLNTERISGAASVIGGGLRAIELAADYANEREVFNEPIGTYQGIQHPLADSYSKLMATREMTYKAAWKFDQGKQCGEEANIAKLRSSEAATEAASRAIQTHGGNGFTPEYQVFYIWLNSRLTQTAPVPNEMVKNFLAEQSLGLPRSYLR